VPLAPEQAKKQRSSFCTNHAPFVGARRKSRVLPARASANFASLTGPSGQRQANRFPATNVGSRIPDMSFIRSVLVGACAFALEIASIGAFCQSVKHDDNKWQNRQHQADLLIQRAFKRFALKDFKGSVQLLKEAATIDPNDPSVSRKLCEAYQWTNELDLAEGACERNIKLDPNPLSYNLLGLAFLAKEDYKQAGKVFENGTTANSQVPVVIPCNLLWVLIGSEQYEQTVSSANQLI